MTAQQNLIACEPEFDTERLDVWEADFTPRPVVDQLFVWMRDELDFRPRTMLDPSAGPGVFCQSAREVWPDVEIVAIEPRPEEHVHLRRHADHVVGSLFEDWIVAHMERRSDFGRRSCTGREPLSFDLLATNPPFSRTAAFMRAGIDLKASWTVLLGTLDWWQRGEEKLADFLSKQIDQHLALQLDIPGAIGFRGGSNGDAKSYAWWCCRPWTSGPRWAALSLPRLSGEQRRWRVRPGTEDTDATE